MEDKQQNQFIDNWRSSLRLNDFYVPEDNSKKCLVLDGQQRLQSFYIALEGSYEGRELCFDILSGDQAVPEDIKYKFAFRTDSGFPWIKFKELVKSNALTNQLSNEIQSRAGRTLGNGEKEKVANHLGLIALTCKIEEVVTYQELDSIDSEELYGDDDVVEVFIRANSGGTRLGKSELLFSLLTVSWETADEAMEDFLTSLNQQGFRFTRDFVLKTCLVLLGHGARYEVKKFREAGVREEIENTWTISPMPFVPFWISSETRPLFSLTRRCPRIWC